MEHREVSKLRPNPLNPRGAVVVDDALRELAESIKSLGVLQPILITPDGTIVAGHRRHKACELLENHLIPVIVREMTDVEQIEVMLVENLQRADLDVVQEGKAYLALEGHGLTLKQISRAVGIAVQTIKTRTAIASLPTECHEAFATRQLPVMVAERLAPLPRDKQIYWVTRAVKEEWTGSELCCQISRAAKGEIKVVLPTPDEQWRDKLSSCMDRLERIDKELDDLNVRGAQVAIRQALNVIVDYMAARKKARAA